MSKLLTGIILGTALIVPAAIQAQDAHDNGRGRQFYDSSHRDWHEWNANEDAAYKRYAQEKHLKDEDFSKANERDQERYWKWRHKHPDEH